MAASSALVEAYYETYTYAQIFDRRKECLSALGNPESLTSDSQAEVALAFEPKSQAEIHQNIEVFNAVLARHDLEAAGEVVPLESRSRYIHLHNRPIE